MELSLSVILNNFCRGENYSRCSKVDTYSDKLLKILVRVQHGGHARTITRHCASISKFRWLHPVLGMIFYRSIKVWELLKWKRMRALSTIELCAFFVSRLGEVHAWANEYALPNSLPYLIIWAPELWRRSGCGIVHSACSSSHHGLKPVVDPGGL
jgi:hypothetical protein